MNDGTADSATDDKLERCDNVISRISEAMQVNIFALPQVSDIPAKHREVTLTHLSYRYMRKICWKDTVTR